MIFAMKKKVIAIRIRNEMKKIERKEKTRQRKDGSECLKLLKEKFLW